MNFVGSTGWFGDLDVFWSLAEGKSVPIQILLEDIRAYFWHISLIIQILNDNGMNVIDLSSISYTLH